MGDTLSELIQNCSFQSLVESVEREKLKKAKLQETIQKLVYYILSTIVYQSVYS